MPPPGQFLPAVPKPRGELLEWAVQRAPCHVHPSLPGDGAGRALVLLPPAGLTGCWKPWIKLSWAQQPGHCPRAVAKLGPETAQVLADLVLRSLPRSRRRDQGRHQDTSPAMSCLQGQERGFITQPLFCLQSASSQAHRSRVRANEPGLSSLKPHSHFSACAE